MLEHKKMYSPQRMECDLQLHIVDLFSYVLTYGNFSSISCIQMNIYYSSRGFDTQEFLKCKISHKTEKCHGNKRACHGNIFSITAIKPSGF